MTGTYAVYVVLSALPISCACMPRYGYFEVCRFRVNQWYMSNLFSDKQQLFRLRRPPGYRPDLRTASALRWTG